VVESKPSISPEQTNGLRGEPEKEEEKRRGYQERERDELRRSPEYRGDGLSYKVSGR